MSPLAGLAQWASAGSHESKGTRRGPEGVASRGGLKAEHWVGLIFDARLPTAYCLLATAFMRDECDARGEESNSHGKEGFNL